ncbi:phosphonate transport system ATP-binding protein [Inhella inkyongensis]|uniref:Phosphonate transport system ATP-binding protein n=1 Tax=Inhella inkyongensis TaxID=392593 RepID=A0A840S9T8_9BURK|nr:ATP-binding cassette domain-containing protein [Inhella inkyongensis]MBB5205160.1 phosphonate transport system ATP-binding protein [Inhella inkyongensis]
MRVDLQALHTRHPAARREAPDALADLSVQIQTGEAVAVIGPSGAGKTSLLHALACALPPTAGQMLLDGQDPWRLSERARHALRGRLCLLPQTPPLPPRQRVVHAVLAGALPRWSLLYSLASLFYPRASDVQAAATALAAFDLADKLWERVDRLSGGERQRVGLARALLSQGSLWLVDEPLSALDPTRAQAALQLLVNQAQARGVTLVASLHHVELALAAFPRVIGLRAGRLLFDLPAAEVNDARLQALYAQHEQELHAPLPSPEPDPVAPVAMTCR